MRNFTPALDLDVLEANLAGRQLLEISQTLGCRQLDKYAGADSGFGFRVDVEGTPWMIIDQH